MPSPTTEKKNEKEYTPAYKMKLQKADQEGDTGYLAGFVSVFNNVDHGQDRVHPGAFSASINAKKGVFPFLLDHNRYEPAGFSTKMEEQGKGLYYEAELKLFDPRVKQRFELAKLSLKLGSPMGNSFGYYAVKYDFEEVETDMGACMVRNLREIMLYEGSVVTFPMNEAAGVTDAKELKFQQILALLQNGKYSEEAMQKALDVLDAPAAHTPMDPALSQSLEAFKGIFR